MTDLKRAAEAVVKFCSSQKKFPDGWHIPPGFIESLRDALQREEPAPNAVITDCVSYDRVLDKAEVEAHWEGYKAELQREEPKRGAIQMTTQPDRRKGERRTYPNLGVVFEHRTPPDRRQVDWRASAQKLQTRLDAAHLNWIAINEKYDALLSVARELRGYTHHIGRSCDDEPNHLRCTCGLAEARAKFAALEGK